MNQDVIERVEVLAKEHGRMVFATAFRVLGNAEDAEDVLQDVFLKLLKPWRRMGFSELVRDWGAYLRVTATRAAVDMLRRRRTDLAVEDLPVPLPAKGEGNPRCLAVRKEQARYLRQALCESRPRDAQVFILRYFEDFSYEEISVHLGIPPSHVGVILHRVRRSLQERLEPFVERLGISEDFIAVQGGD